MAIRLWDTFYLCPPTIVVQDSSGTISIILTPVLLNRIYPAFANSIDPDQLASEEANWSGSALFAFKHVNLF